MRLLELLEHIKGTFESLPTVNSAYVANPDIWNDKQVRYISVCVDIQSTNMMENTMERTISIWIANRHKNQESAALIWQECEEAWLSAYEKLATELVFVTPVQISYFEQDFNDQLAGVEVNLTIETEIEPLCI
mgnify:CR=1 FL=1